MICCCCGGYSIPVSLKVRFVTKDSSSFDVTLFAGNTALQKAVDEVRLGQSEQEGNHEDEHHNTSGKEQC